MVATELSQTGFELLRTAIRGTSVRILKGNGLMPLTEVPLDAVVVAGMDYDTILSILRDSRLLTGEPAFLLQPMQGALLLHRAIVQARWRIVKADIVRQRDRLYPTWQVDCFHLGSHVESDRIRFLPTEFRASIHYGVWLEREGLFRKRQRVTPLIARELYWLQEELEDWRRDR